MCSSDEERLQQLERDLDNVLVRMTKFEKALCRLARLESCDTQAIPHLNWQGQWRPKDETK